MYMTKELMQWILSQQPPHPGFGFHVWENQDGIWLIVSLEEFAKYPQAKQEDLATWMGFLCNSIRQRGVPCFIERLDAFETEETHT